MRVNNSALGEGESWSPRAGVMGVKHHISHTAQLSSAERNTRTTVEGRAAEREAHLKHNAVSSQKERKKEIPLLHSCGKTLTIIFCHFCSENLNHWINVL